MYCRKCGALIPKGSTYCDECGTSTDPKRDKELLKQKEIERYQKEQKRKKEKKQEYHNNPAVIGFLIALTSFVLACAPAGRETQKTWWYLGLVIITAVASIYFALQGKKINDALDRRYRIQIHPRLIQFTYFLGGLVIFMWFVVMYQLLTHQL